MNTEIHLYQVVSSYKETGHALQIRNYIPITISEYKTLEGRVSTADM
jgi:hypothetical protein